MVALHPGFDLALLLEEVALVVPLLLVHDLPYWLDCDGAPQFVLVVEVALRVVLDLVIQLR